MKNNRYKILVLSDLKDSTNSILKSSVSLAKMINGDVAFFHVKKATDVVENDSQLSAIRTINKLHTKTRSQIHFFRTKSTATETDLARAQSRTTEMEYALRSANFFNVRTNCRSDSFNFG